jgi:CheY-like chemotaxis protein
MVPRGRVLVIDESTSVRMNLAGLLRGLRWHVDTAPSAQLALDTIARCHPDVVLTELQLPDGRGLHFARKLRSMVEHDLVVVGVTRLPPSLRMEARSAGYDAVFPKPVDIDVLDDFLQQATDAAQR